ncbi:unnamed protein product [Urochloa humidicola]
MFLVLCSCLWRRKREARPAGCCFYEEQRRVMTAAVDLEGPMVAIDLRCRASVRQEKNSRQRLGRPTNQE